METRIGNIEFRTAPIEGTNQRHIEIICWTPNSLYGKESDYEQNDQNDKAFSEKEVCYIIATINIDKHPDIKSYGMRAFQLDEHDDKDFKKIVIYAYQYATKLWNGLTTQLI